MTRDEQTEELLTRLQTIVMNRNDRWAVRMDAAHAYAAILSAHRGNPLPPQPVKDAPK